MDASSLLAALQSYTGQDSSSLQGLEAAIQLAVSLPTNRDVDRALFRLFEDFPQEDGYGVYWEIVHGLELRGDYEAPLLASLRHRPSPFGLTMAHRLLNAGQGTCAGVSIITLLYEVARSNTAPSVARESAKELLQHHGLPAS